MNRTLIVAVLGGAIGFLLAFVSGSLAGNRMTDLEQLSLLVDVRHEIVSEFVEEADEQKMIQAAVRAMIEALDDRHTVYLDPSDLEQFDKQVRGSFPGIGAEVDMRDGQLHIVSPLEDSPAWKAGVMAGDIVLGIDGVSLNEIVEGHRTDNERLKVAINQLTGESGTVVQIRVRHDSGEEELIRITRAQINVPTVRGLRRDDEGKWDYFLDLANQIGYIRINQFTDATAGHVKTALTELQEMGMRGLILDVRFNPGGLLEAAADVCDLFLEKGKPIVSIKGRSVPSREIHASQDPVAPDVSVVILANEFSASAAEIVTGSLSQNERAVFVGTRTFGKGSVQQVKKLEFGPGAIKITNAYYYLPNGRNIHKRKKNDEWGVDPKDGFYVPMTSEEIKQMLMRRSEAEVPGENDGSDPETPVEDIVTPESIEQSRADPQLAAALRAVLGKLESDEWPQVGKSGARHLAKQTQRERLQRRRRQLEEAVAQLDEELEALEEDEGELENHDDDSADRPTPDEPL